MINLLIKILISTTMISHSYNAKNHDQVNLNPGIITKVLPDDGIFPNNILPAIVYQNVLVLSGTDPAKKVEEVFRRNGWENSWRNGIYGFHHYHSTAHEVLGVYDGTVRAQLGGDKGEVFELKKGDVVLIPAGVAHKSLGSSSDFRVVGAYPKGQSWDMNYGREGERPTTDENIRNVPLPEKDPVFGADGPVVRIWINGN